MDTYKWGAWKSNGYLGFTKYVSSSDPYSGYDSFYDDKTTLETEDDVAHVKWGGNWRMPTTSEWQELFNKRNCSWKWTELYGMEGYLITSKMRGFEGNAIFLPASGGYYNDELYDENSGYYWSSSLEDGSAAYAVSFDSYGVDDDISGYRWFGRNVRPVCP